MAAVTWFGTTAFTFITSRTRTELQARTRYKADLLKILSAMSHK